MKEYEHPRKKVRRYIEQSDTFDYGMVVGSTARYYLVQPTSQDRKVERWLKTDCEIV